MLWPRPAVEWLLKMPQRNDLVPESLRFFIEGRGQAPVTQQEPRGPVTKNVIKAMEAYRPDELRAMTEAEMEVRFKASRYTCRIARAWVLSEESADHRPTTDK